MIIFVGKDPYSVKSKQQYRDKNYPITPKFPVAFITRDFNSGKSQTMRNLLKFFKVDLNIFAGESYPQNLLTYFEDRKIYLCNTFEDDTDMSANVKAVKDIKKLCDNSDEKVHCVLFGDEARYLQGQLSMVPNIVFYFAPHPSQKNHGKFEMWIKNNFKNQPKFKGRYTPIKYLRHNIRLK